MANENTENKAGFFDKVKAFFSKFFAGAKSFAVKTGRVNSANCYGVIDKIGDFLVYEDHALISAVGMDDVVFTRQNVLDYSFEGLGSIRRHKVYVKYHIVLDDNVVFPEKVAEKNDTKNLVALIAIAKEKDRFLGRGKQKAIDCDVYGYKGCLIMVWKVPTQVGEKVEIREEATLYPYDDVVTIEEKSDKTLVLELKDGKKVALTPKDNDAYELVKNIKEA